MWLHQSHLRRGTGCSPQRKFNAYRFMVWPVPPSIASFVQQCYPHKNRGHTKQPLHLTKQMGKFSMEAVPALRVVQPAITLLHWSRGPSSTSLPQKWGVPAKPRKDPTPMNMLEVVKPKYEMVPQHSHTDTEPIDPALGIVDTTWVMSLREDLERSSVVLVMAFMVIVSFVDCKVTLV